MITPALQKLRLRQESKPRESGKQQSEELSYLTHMQVACPCLRNLWLPPGNQLSPGNLNPWKERISPFGWEFLIRLFPPQDWELCYDVFLTDSCASFPALANPSKTNLQAVDSEASRSSQAVGFLQALHNKVNWATVSWTVIVRSARFSQGSDSFLGPQRALLEATLTLSGHWGAVWCTEAIIYRMVLRRPQRVKAVSKRT